MDTRDLDVCVDGIDHAQSPPDRAGNGTISLLIVACGLPTGGTERHLSLILPRLAERGIKPIVVSLGDDGPMSGPIRDAGIKIEFPLAESRFIEKAPWPFRGLMAYASAVLRLRRIIKREQPDILHSFLPMATIIGGLAAKLAGPRAVITSRRSLRHYQADNRLLALVERHLTRGMTAVLGNSRAVVAELAEEGVGADRIGLIYNGVAVGSAPQNRNGQSIRQSLGISDDSFVLLTVANLIPYKGHRDLLRAVALAADDLPQPWTLLCAGRDDGIGDDLESYAGELGIRENLRLLGEFEDVGALYRAADVSVLASHQEGFSNALLESLAAGLPAIATAVGGNAEAIGDGDAGRLVPPKDPAAMAEAIREIGGDKALRHRMRAAAERRAHALFSLDACVERYENLYRGLLSGRGGPIDALIDGR